MPTLFTILPYSPPLSSFSLLHYPPFLSYTILSYSPLLSSSSLLHYPPLFSSTTTLFSPPLSSSTLIIYLQIWFTLANFPPLIFSTRLLPSSSPSSSNLVFYFPPLSRPSKSLFSCAVKTFLLKLLRKQMRKKTFKSHIKSVKTCKNM